MVTYKSALLRLNIRPLKLFLLSVGSNVVLDVTYHFTHGAIGVVPLLLFVAFLLDSIVSKIRDMKSRRFLLVIGAFIVVVSSVCGVTYAITRHATFQQAYGLGKSQGTRIGYVQGYKSKNTASNPQNAQTTSNCPTYDPFHVYSCTPTTAAPATTPTQCTSTNYGINNQFTSTNCY